jgi:hypothetical protein
MTEDGYAFARIKSRPQRNNLICGPTVGLLNDEPIRFCVVIGKG